MKEKITKKDMLEALNHTLRQLNQLPDNPDVVTGICGFLYFYEYPEVSWDDNFYIKFIENNRPSSINRFKKVYNSEYKDSLWFWPVRDTKSRIKYLEIMIKAIEDGKIRKFNY